MPIGNFKIFLIFLAAFFVMHLSGMWLVHLPYILNAIIVSFSVVSILLLLNKWLYAKTTKNAAIGIGLKSISINSIIPGLSLSLLLLLMYPLLGYIFNTTISIHKNWLWNAMGLLLTAGIAEEVLFRGFLFGKLRETMNFRKAAIMSIAAFSMAHLLMFTYMDWTIALPSTLLAIGLSVPFAYLYEKAENSVWSAALVHASIRTIGMLFVTEEENYIALVLSWMVTSLLIPNILLLFSKQFKKLWNNNLTKV